MHTTDIGDPRLQALFGVTEPARPSVRPIVQLPRKGMSPALFGVIIVVLSVTLFLILNERRTGQVQPAVRATASDVSPNSWPAPPPLVIPPTEVSDSDLPAPQPNAAPRTSPTPSPSLSHRPTLSPQMSPPPALPFMTPRPISPVRPPTPSGPLLIDGRVSARTRLRPIPGGTSSQVLSDRVRASALANPSLTVPQGSLIPAVLETGFDSTRPGFARAIVSRDVQSFDGENVLIPRGSRLIGASRSPIADGQKSVFITWTRLIRPDGVTIEMDSPATDTVGRGGVTASVDTHFLSRVGTLISKAIDAFSQIIAARAGPLLILPASGSLAKPQMPARPKRAPTLKVAPGTSISVFVAHDLDFSGTGDGQ